IEADERAAVRAARGRGLTAQHPCFQGDAAMKRILLGSFAVIAALHSPAVAAIKATATVDTHAAGVRIAPEVYGQFSEELGNGINGGIWVGTNSPIPNIKGYRRDVVEALQRLHVPLLRWP